MNVVPSKRSPSAKGVLAAVANGCSTAGIQIDPWSIYFEDCVITVPTNVSARCSDGFTFTPVLVQPGTYDIYVDCYPAFFSSLLFNPV
jgi:hypothetical protein